MIDVTCAIILKNNKILVTQRSEKMILPMKWEFPGGKVQLGESANNCLLREIKEELNLEIEILEMLDSMPYEYDTFSINLIPFVSKYVSGEIILYEHKDFKWLPKEELNNLDWAPADISVLNNFLKFKYDSARSI
jgi:8-oxo-dGTP diphosphatase